jgi:hypothetical protein
MTSIAALSQRKGVRTGHHNSRWRNNGPNVSSQQQTLTSLEVNRYTGAPKEEYSSRYQDREAASRALQQDRMCWKKSFGKEKRNGQNKQRELRPFTLMKLL